MQGPGWWCRDPVFGGSDGDDQGSCRVGAEGLQEEGGKKGIYIIYPPKERSLGFTVRESTSLRAVLLAKVRQQL